MVAGGVGGKSPLRLASPPERVKDGMTLHVNYT